MLLIGVPFSTRTFISQVLSTVVLSAGFPHWLRIPVLKYTHYFLKYMNYSRKYIVTIPEKTPDKSFFKASMLLHVYQANTLTPIDRGCSLLEYITVTVTVKNLHRFAYPNFNVHRRYIHSSFTLLLN